MVGETHFMIETNRRWYQIRLWHLFVATTILCAASFILAHMLKPEPVEVRGCVTIDGNPLPNGLITVFSDDRNKRKRLSQRISDDGWYAFSDGIETGVYFAEISSPKTTGKSTVEIIPARYNTKTALTMTLTPGTNVIHFELSSR